MGKRMTLLLSIPIPPLGTAQTNSPPNTARANLSIHPLISSGAKSERIHSVYRHPKLGILSGGKWWLQRNHSRTLTDLVLTFASTVALIRASHPPSPSTTATTSTSITHTQHTPLFYFLFRPPCLNTPLLPPTLITNNSRIHLRIATTYSDRIGSHYPVCAGPATARIHGPLLYTESFSETREQLD
jgi:hypothetical protein